MRAWQAERTVASTLFSSLPAPPAITGLAAGQCSANHRHMTRTNSNRPMPPCPKQCWIWVLAPCRTPRPWADLAPMIARVVGPEGICRCHLGAAASGHNWAAKQAGTWMPARKKGASAMPCLTASPSMRRVSTAIASVVRLRLPLCLIRLPGLATPGRQPNGLDFASSVAGAARRLGIKSMKAAECFHCRCGARSASRSGSMQPYLALRLGKHAFPPHALVDALLRSARGEAASDAIQLVGTRPRCLSARCCPALMPDRMSSCRVGGRSLVERGAEGCPPSL